LAVDKTKAQKIEAEQVQQEEATWMPFGFPFVVIS